MGRERNGEGGCLHFQPPSLWGQRCSHIWGPWARALPGGYNLPKQPQEFPEVITAHPRPHQMQEAQKPGDRMGTWVVSQAHFWAPQSLWFPSGG